MRHSCHRRVDHLGRLLIGRFGMTSRSRNRLRLRRIALGSMLPFVAIAMAPSARAFPPIIATGSISSSAGGYEGCFNVSTPGDSPCMVATLEEHGLHIRFLGWTYLEDVLVPAESFQKLSETRIRIVADLPRTGHIDITSQGYFSLPASADPYGCGRLHWAVSTDDYSRGLPESGESWGSIGGTGAEAVFAATANCGTFWSVPVSGIWNLVAPFPLLG